MEIKYLEGPGLICVLVSGWGALCVLVFGLRGWGMGAIGAEGGGGLR